MHEVNMVYYKDENILVRNMIETDSLIIYNAEVEQGHHRTIEQFSNRLKDQQEGRAISLVAEYLGNVAGYVNVYINSPWGAFANKGYCEIIDFGVFDKFRKRGIGGKLMDVAEQIASTYSDIVYLCVGLHSGYGSAQRMYVKRGYIPDGSGVWYGSCICNPYETYPNDDDLNLYFSKKLK